MFGGLGNSIGNAFSTGISSVKSTINNLITGINTAITGINKLSAVANKATGIPAITIPTIPKLAKSGTILPRPGGTLILAAEAGRAESVVDTGKLNYLMDAAAAGGGERGGFVNYGTIQVTD